MDSAGTAAPVGCKQLGVIKWYNARKGFGFISPDLDDIPFTIDVVAWDNKSSSSSDGGGADVAAARRPAAPADVFMHKSVMQPGISTEENERVEFELGLDKRGRKVAMRVWSSAKPPALHHRQWVAADFEQLKSLHEEWFPVRYPDTYWRQACERHLSLEGWPLLTLTSYTPGNVGRVVGCMSAVIMDIHACTDLDPATITGANGEPAETALYLKTLGVREEARRHGCALELVNACELYAKQVGGPGCGALWLHVIAYNKGAIRLYERAGFRMAAHLPQFYSIRGERFDAYLYVKATWPAAGAKGSPAQRTAATSAAQKTSQPLGSLRDWI